MLLIHLLCAATQNLIHHRGSRGVYRPVWVLFETHIYLRAKQICWHTQFFKAKMALTAELLHLQQSHQLPPEVVELDEKDGSDNLTNSP